MSAMATLMNFPKLRHDFVALCREADIVDKRRGWVNIDQLWWEPDTRSRFASIVAAYIGILAQGTETQSRRQTVVVTPDTVSSSYGIAPVIFIAAHELGYPVAVWQEIGDFAAHKPLLIGTRRTGLRCIVLQDTIRHGTTVLKIIDSLKRREWDLVVYASFALNCRHPHQLQSTKEQYREMTGDDLNLQYLATADELG
jgi:hypothetical protein